MKTTSLLTLLSLAGALIAGAAEPKDEVLAAARKLGEQPNYSWKTTVVVPENAQFRPGPSDGKTEKDGFTHVTSSFGDNTTQTVLKGGKGAVTNQDGGWQSLEEVEKEEGFARFRAIMARNLKVPAVQATDLATGAKELKKDGDTYAGELTEDAAKNLMSFGRRGAGGDAPSVTNAKGSVKFWLKDGALVKYEFKAKGIRSFNGNDMEIDRTTIVEIKDVGTTKITVPEESKKKL
ncbi:MAG: hypothetical protein EXS31_11575 [Pedosphaera sp.]|nr:hypothetical protein [Pedosphaera sp.]